MMHAISEGIGASTYARAIPINPKVVNVSNIHTKAIRTTMADRIAQKKVKKVCPEPEIRP